MEGERERGRVREKGMKGEGGRDKLREERWERGTGGARERERERETERWREERE